MGEIAQKEGLQQQMYENMIHRRKEFLLYYE